MSTTTLIINFFGRSGSGFGSGTGSCGLSGELNSRVIRSAAFVPEHILKNSIGSGFDSRPDKKKSEMFFVHNFQIVNLSAIQYLLKDYEA